jgi:hypothetical protein
VNHTATNSVCVHFCGTKHRLSSCNFHRNSQLSTSFGFFLI